MQEMSTSVMKSDTSFKRTVHSTPKSAVDSIDALKKSFSDEFDRFKELMLEKLSSFSSAQKALRVIQHVTGDDNVLDDEPSTIESADNFHLSSTFESRVSSDIEVSTEMRKIFFFRFQ